MQRLQPDPLYAALEQSLTEDQFEAKKFFKVWFRQYGEPYFFLFTKNLKVTNMQVAELHALLRTHIVWRKTKTRVRDFQLIDVHEFYESVQSLHNSFNPANSEGSVPGPTSNDVIPELYGDLIRDIVCIQLFFGSCAVFLPPGMTLNPLAICAESGYIHSCGPSVWNRKIAKATKKGLTDRLEEHLNKRNIKKARLIVYAHEDFTEHDRNNAQALKDGLDDVKLHLEKYYIGKESLVQVLQKIQVHFGDRLEVAEPEHYKKGKNSSTVSTIPVIWLLVERTPTSEIIHRGKEQYYVLYEQEYKNENPHHIFDENKPAWIDHTTIPHTLVAAMINITRPWWREDQSPTFADPFVGTGTTWLEAIKFDSIQSSCGDSEPLSPLAIQDNVEFFCANNETLLRYIVGIRLAAHITVTRTGIIEDAPDTDPDFELLFKDEDFRFQCIRDYDWARRQFALARPDSQKRDVSFAEVLSDLKGGTELQRILFYLLIRTHRRHFAALVDRASSNQHKAFGKEATLLAEQISTLRSHVQRRESAASATGAHLLFEGKYSRMIGDN